MTFVTIGKPTRAKASGFGFNLQASLDRVREGFDMRQAYLSTRRELSAMSDRDLADIGVRRGDIHEIALGTLVRATN
ncbi:hypothetical protein GALL_454030 [mine drainage metagenome]|uniref:YjiS-like domain-containing protein n=1 Tax=mine drainage metagenome TaxID=410659 RepID=A0A1J5PN29_9ZZZZ